MDLDALKAEGQSFLQPLLSDYGRPDCIRCTIRRRSSFGWVYEPCGLCVKTTTPVFARFLARRDEQGWLGMPKWGGKYLAGDASGPLPAPWVVYQSRDGQQEMAAPGWVVRLLLLGNPMKSYVRKTGGIAIQWPKLFYVVARNPEMRAAVDATVILADGGEFKPSEATCEQLYTFLLELETSVFGGVAQENTQLKPNVITRQEFAPPIKVVGKLIR